MAKQRSTSSISWAWAAIVLALGPLGCPQPVTTDLQAATAPLEIAGEAYATSDACRACHPSQYASWYASYHRTMTRPATPANVFGNFDDVTTSGGGSTRYPAQTRPTAYAAFATHPRVWLQFSRWQLETADSFRRS